MGKGLARLIGSGIGFTSEAIHAARHRGKDSISEQGSSSASPSASVPASAAASAYETPRGFPSDTPPTFPPSEADGHEQLRDLSLDEDLPAYSPGAGRSSDATYPDEKSRSHSYEAGEDSGDEYDEIVHYEESQREYNGDEEAWELDEVSEALPAYDELDGAPGELPRRNTEDDPDAIHQDDSAETKEKKRDRMIRELVAMAGPPGPKTKLPFPVIIPQRRPGAKRRGFVRAYAPVLQDCGIGQDVFLKFISDFHKASQVRYATFCRYLPHCMGYIDFIIGFNVAAGPRCHGGHHWLVPLAVSLSDCIGRPNHCRDGHAIPNSQAHHQLP